MVGNCFQKFIFAEYSNSFRIKNMKTGIVFLLTLVCLAGSITSCNTNKSKENMTLFDKSLPEIKKAVNGKWELVSGQNARETGEFENTFITFNDDKYIWSENGKDEPGDLNWRKGPTGIGYDSYLMDVFYAERPAYPISIQGDILYIQDISDTGYKYTLKRVKK